MNNFKTVLIRGVTFCAGLYFILKFLLPKENGLINFTPYHEHIINGLTTVSAMAIGLGLINLLFSHGSTVVYKKTGWIFSFVLLASLFVMLFVQGSFWLASLRDADLAAKFVNLADFSKIIVTDSAAQKQELKPRAQRETLLIQAFRTEYQQLSSELKNQADLISLDSEIEVLFADGLLKDSEHLAFQDKTSIFSNLLRAHLDQQRQYSLISKLNKILNDGLFVALGSAMFALLGFYIAAAAYRAFRIKSIEAALMMSAALIVMLGQIPFGLWISPELPRIRLWLLQVPSAGAARAIEIGSGIAGLILAVRMWLSLEENHSGKQ